jgi:hypothetical protein
VLGLPTRESIGLSDSRPRIARWIVRTWKVAAVTFVLVLVVLLIVLTLFDFRGLGDGRILGG